MRSLNLTWLVLVPALVACGDNAPEPGVNTFCPDGQFILEDGGCLPCTVERCGMGGAGGYDGTGGFGGGDPDLADHELLLTCGPTEVCRPAFAECIEVFAEQSAIRNVECVLTALRDGTPGRYTIELDETNSGGSERFTHRFVITSSGEVERAVVRHLNDQINDVRGTDYLPTERCERRSAAFYEGRRAQIAEIPRSDTGEVPSSNENQCVLPREGEEQWLDWFDDCVPSTPTCGNAPNLAP